MHRISLIAIITIGLAYTSIVVGAASTSDSMLLVRSSLPKPRIEVAQVKNRLLLPQDRNIRLAYIWLATAVFFFLLETVSGRLYAFSGGTSAILLVVFVSLARSTEATIVQIGGWVGIATGIRLLLPYWIRAHNDELRDRRRVAREAREAQARADALSVEKAKLLKSSRKSDNPPR